MQKQAQVSTTPFSVNGQLRPGLKSTQTQPIPSPCEELNINKNSGSVASLNARNVDIIPNTSQVNTSFHNDLQLPTQVKQKQSDYTYQAHEPFDNVSNDFHREFVLHECIDNSKPVTRFPHLLCSPRPHSIPDWIPIPKVDSQILTNRHQIFAKMWPNTTSEAATAYPQFCELFQDVKSFNLPNFLGARRTLSSGLNLEAWETSLEGYHDSEICSFLRYGWPVGYHKETPPVSIKDNHPSATAHAQHIRQFIQDEIAHEAIIGPLKSPPFKPWTLTSPLMTRPKKNSEKRRVIIDLSFPAGCAVNDGINIHSIYGRDTAYTLPCISDFTTHVKKLGPTAWAWKADLSRAYRQLRVDPIDVPLLGLTFKDNVYIDLCPSFGCKSLSASCQRMAMAVVYLMAKHGWTVLAFLDDFAGVEQTQLRAEKAYNQFLQISKELGLQLALDKCAPPSQQLQWLGYDIDILNMVISIPKEKLDQVLEECSAWTHKAKASERMIQSLIGKLLHVANCITHGRKFVTRILAMLRYMKSVNRMWTTVGPEFRADIAWFLHYSQKGNGIALINPTLETIYIECDSSLSAGGGSSVSHCYFWVYTKHHMQKYTQIHQLEAINLLVAYRTLCPLQNTTGKKVIIVTDNSGSAYALTTGKTKDPTLAACAREMWLHATCADHQIEIQHQTGDCIPLSDALSRAHFDARKAKLASDTIQSRNLILVKPKLANYVFFTDGI